MAQASWVKPDFNQFTLPGSSKPRKRLINATDTKSKTSKCPGDANLWVNKHKAENVDELVVQKKKISDVRSWLHQATSTTHNKAPMLLITGPSGSGKFETLNLLCKEMNIDIHQWEEPIRYTSNAEFEFNQGSYRDGPKDMNPLEHLRDFMSRANRYSSIQIKTSDQTVSKKIVLIKDLPAMVYGNLNAWQDLLRDYSVRGKTPVIFIVTEGNTNFGTSLKLFPSKLQEQLLLSTISLNALANTFIMKALQRILTREKKSLPPEYHLEDVIESSNGDLRNAINTLQLLCIRGNSGTSLTRTKKRKLTPEGKSTSSFANGRDGSLDFMHALGKILYAKRSSDCQLPDGDLPPHLVEEMRIPLQENINSLVDKIGESSSKVLLYLHHNYPPFFGHIEDAAKAVHHLSTAELFSDFLLPKDSLEQYSLLVSVLGLMHSNTEVVGSSWRPLKRPEYWNVQQKVQETMAEGRQLWPLMNDAHFFPEIIPFMRKMSNQTSLSSGQRMFLQKVSTFQQSRFAEWSNPMESDADEVSDDRNVFRLVASRNTGNTSSQVNPGFGEGIEEDEEVIIEEYDD